MKRPIYKSLNHLRQSLNIPEINTNKQFSHTGCENGVFFTNNDGVGQILNIFVEL